MTEEDKVRVDAMSQEDMARTWRFAATGAWPFHDTEVGQYFKDAFLAKGGFTPEISKRIGF